MVTAMVLLRTWHHDQQQEILKKKNPFISKNPFSASKLVYASLGKVAATGNPDVQAIGSWSRQV